jgi:hypothetical protein
MNTVSVRFLTAAVLAAALYGCNDHGTIQLPGRNLDGQCPIPQTLLGGIWLMDFGPGSAPVLAECQDASLNGLPVRVRIDGVPCVGPLPCPPGGTNFDARVLFVVDDQDGALIAIQGTGYFAGDVMNAEVRTGACLTGFDFEQAQLNDPLTLDIRCAGGFDARAAKMSAVCQSVYVESGGTTTLCAIDPPLHPVVTLQPDPVIILESAGS